MERLKQVPRSERASVLYKDKLARHGFRVEDCFTETNMLCYYAGPRFFFQSWCDYFTGKRKTLCTIPLRYIRHVSSDWRQFHPHLQACAYCVCGRVYVCEYVRAGECVCMASRCAPAAAEYLPASQLVQTVELVEPAIYVHTLSHTTKGGAR